MATVTDQFDNQVENFPLTARADNGATVVDPNQQTDDNGQVTIRFSSETAGDSKLVVEGTGTSKSVTAQFVADMSTAQIQMIDSERLLPLRIFACSDALPADLLMIFTVAVPSGPEITVSVWPLLPSAS